MTGGPARGGAPPVGVIAIRGACEHNLKDVSIDLPSGSLTVFTGVSGSGKSSLAHDTIYREGQRRFLESLSAYARQYLGSMERPRVDRIEGLSPTVAIDQKTAGRSPRSTVGTITEIYDHQRLLFARLGAPHCPACGRRIEPQSPARIADRILEEHSGRAVLLCAPVVRARKGDYRKRLLELRAAGHVRLRVDGRMLRLDREEPPVLGRYQRHTIEIVHDRIEVKPEARSRLTDSLEKCLALADGVAVVLVLPRGSREGPSGGPVPTPEVERLFSSRYACPACGGGLPEMEPRLFSFNSPHGACPRCQGLG
ncbi:MAG: excinuclease ABC subunit UvrA, partial [Thermoanaerobaculia bacterium]